MQLGVMHQVAPDDLSATLAEMGLAPHFLAPDSQDQGDSPSRAPHQNRQRRRTSRAAGRVDQSLFCRCDAAVFCAHHASERQRLTERQSFIFSVIGTVGLVLGAVLLAAVSGPTQSS
jgi:hypothetical protein